MEVIAQAQGIEIFTKKEWDGSFFASPFIAHREYAAVDIYQGGEFGQEAVSPVEGRVYDIRRFKSPSPGKDYLYEYLILIEQGDYLARLMHVEPVVEKGDFVRVGDVIGRFIRNGYFFYWVDPGMHVEIRDKENYIRSRGGYELKPLLREEPAGDEFELSGEIVAKTKRNIGVRLGKKPFLEVGENRKPAWGEFVSCLDYGGVLGKFEKGQGVYFNGMRIGTVVDNGTYSSLFKIKDRQVFIDKQRYKGLCVFFANPVVRLLPMSYGKTAGEGSVEIDLR